MLAKQTVTPSSRRPVPLGLFVDGVICLHLLAFLVTEAKQQGTEAAAGRAVSGQLRLPGDTGYYSGEGGTAVDNNGNLQRSACTSQKMRK